MTNNITNYEGGVTNLPLIETVKSFAGVVQKINDFELNKKLVDLQIEVMALLEENHELKTKLEEIKKVQDIEQHLSFEGQVYYFEKDNEKEGPYCSACWDKDSKLVRVHVDDDFDVPLAQCPVCETSANKF